MPKYQNPGLPYEASQHNCGITLVYTIAVVTKHCVCAIVPSFLSSFIVFFCIGIRGTDESYLCRLSRYTCCKFSSLAREHLLLCIRKCTP